MNTSWRPSATRSALAARSAILAKIRQFFAERGVLEVETPLLGFSTATDPHLHSLKVPLQDGKTAFLQTSPEFPMKRLLASGSGSIYSLGKVFRAEESGRYHNLEFTMLEWYQVGFDHHQLMDEMDAFLALILDTKPADRFSYREIFIKILSIDPFNISVKELKNSAQKEKIGLSDFGEDKDTWLQLLMSHCIEPQLSPENPTFIYDFPPSQAALAKINDHKKPAVGERFEVYYGGIELANGYHELSDTQEQRIRFEADNKKRKAMHLPELPIDEHLLSALEADFPSCAGVALGVDRLIMLALGAEHINDVITFPFDRL